MKKLSILSVALIATFPAWSQQKDEAMGNTKVNTDFSKYKTFTWAKSDPTAVGPEGYDIYYYEITPDRTSDMDRSRDMNRNKDDKTYNNDKNRTYDRTYDKNKTDQDKTMDRDRTDRTYNNRDNTTDQNKSYDKNSTTDRNRTSSDRATDKTYNQTDRNKTSDETQTSDLNRTSDQTRTSDPNKTSDQYRSTDPNKTSDQTRTSDQNRTSDQTRTSDPNRTSDQYRTTDPNKTSDQNRTSDQSTTSGQTQDKSYNQNNDDMNRTRTDSYGNKPSGYVYSYTMIIPARDTQTNDAIIDGISNEMEARGYREAGDGADLIVSYQVLDQKATLHGFNNDDPTTVSGGNQVRQPSDTATFVLEPGTLLVSLIDAKTSEMIWHGWSSGMVDNSKFTSDQVELKEAIHSIFDKFNHKADEAKK